MFTAPLREGMQEPIILNKKQSRIKLGFGALYIFCFML